MHEANEVYNYHGCVEQETNHHVKAIWERFLDYELAHFHLACAALKMHEKRDPADIITHDFAQPLAFRSQRAFVRKVLASEVDLRTDGLQFVPRNNESPDAVLYRTRINVDGSPSSAVAAGYIWMPGTELNRRTVVRGYNGMLS